MLYMIKLYVLFNINNTATSHKHLRDNKKTFLKNSIISLKNKNYLPKRIILHMNRKICGNKKKFDFFKHAITVISSF